jgi:hypothetical protein
VARGDVHFRPPPVADPEIPKEENPPPPQSAILGLKSLMLDGKFQGVCVCEAGVKGDRGRGPFPSNSVTGHHHPLHQDFWFQNFLA